MESKRKLRPVYGVGLVALERKPDKVYETKDEAIKAAAAAGLSFIVEFKGETRKILSWNSKVEKRDILLEKYKKRQDADKIAVLNLCEEPYWLELRSASNANHIMPLSSVEAYEHIEV